jgi:hypothetical protein
VNLDDDPCGTAFAKGMATGPRHGQGQRLKADTALTRLCKGLHVEKETFGLQLLHERFLLYRITDTKLLDYFIYVEAPQHILPQHETFPSMFDWLIRTLILFRF